MTVQGLGIHTLLQQVASLSHQSPAFFFSSLLSLLSLWLSDTNVDMSLKYEPASEPLHFYVTELLSMFTAAEQKGLQLKDAEAHLRRTPLQA